MAISNVIEKLGRAIFEAPFATTRLSKEAPELAEIRLAVLDDVKAKSHRAHGQNVFPYNVIRIRLLGIPEDGARVFRGEFLANYFAEEVRNTLKRSSFRFPKDLRVEIVTTSKLPSPGEQWIFVELESDDRATSAAEAVDSRRASLVVLHGTANRDEITLDKARTNIGRTADVHRAAGPSRRNDLAFSEENEINATVSREHAHILHSQQTGEYRIFNDRWYKGDGNCGLWIVRDGLSRPVHHGQRGAVLKPGDEIHLGRAVLRFQLLD